MSNILKENEIIEKISSYIQPAANVYLGIGDDAAVIAPQAGYLQLSSVDQLVCGTHFLAEHDPQSLGHKALAISISDILAMGGMPQYALLTITAPEIESAWLDSFCAGLFAVAKEFSVNLIGGNCSRGQLAIATTVLGSVLPENLLKRSTACVGDDVWLLGSVGAAALAREQIFATGASNLADYWLYPKPQAQILRLRNIANAAMDISDGLYPDLQKMSVASKCGIDLYHEVLCQQAWAKQSNSENLQDLVLFGGEDYAICVTISESERDSVSDLLGDDFPCLRIGKVTAQAGIRLLDQNLQPITVNDKTWQHF